MNTDSDISPSVHHRVPHSAAPAYDGGDTEKGSIGGGGASEKYLGEGEDSARVRDADEGTASAGAAKETEEGQNKSAYRLLCFAAAQSPTPAVMVMFSVLSRYPSALLTRYQRAERIGSSHFAFLRRCSFLPRLDILL